MDLETLNRGDIVRHKMTGNSYVIIDDNPLTCVRVVHITNVSEWVLVGKNDLNKGEKVKLPDNAYPIA